VCASAVARRLLRGGRGAGCGQVVGGLRSRRWLRGVCRSADSWRQAFEWPGEVCRVAVSVRQAVKWLGRPGRGGGVVVDAQVLRSSVGRWCGAHTALLLVSLSLGGKSCDRRSAAGAARTRRWCSWHCRWAQGVRSTVGRWCGAHAALLLVSLSFGRKSCGRRSAAGAACTRRCFACRCRLGASCAVGGRQGESPVCIRAGMYSIEVRFVALAMLRNGVARQVIYENVGVKRSTLKRWAAYHRDQGPPWHDPVHRNLHTTSC